MRKTMDKLFYNQDLMKYITTYIEKDPRKKYPDQEQKRRKLNKIIEDQYYDPEIVYNEKSPQLWMCEYCEEPYIVKFMVTGRPGMFYIKQEGGFDCCKECEDKGF